jgi:hypothetical protein
MISLAEQYLNVSSAQDNTNTNTNTTKVMGKNIVKAELVVNITLSATNILSAGTLDAAQSKKGVIIRTRSVGSLNYNTSDDSVYASFIPLSEKSVDAYGKYNCAVWKLTDDQGVEEILSHEESLNLWASLLHVGNDEVSNIDFFVKANFSANDTFQSVNRGLREGVIRSYSIVFNDLNNMFEFRTDAYRNNLCLIPANATVEFNRTVTELAQETLGLNGVTMDSIRVKAEQRRTDFRKFMKAPTKSSVRREDRKVAAATINTPAEIAFDFGVSTVATSVTSTVTEVVSTITEEVQTPEVVTVPETVEVPAPTQVAAAKEGAKKTSADFLAARKAKRAPISFDSAPVSVTTSKVSTEELSADDIDAILDAMDNDDTGHDFATNNW